MNKLFIYELRKLIGQKYLVFFVFLLLGVNIFNIYFNYDKLLTPEKDLAGGEIVEWESLRLEMQTDFSGKITSDSLQAITAHRDEAQRLLETGEGDTRLYTPLPYSDMNYSNEIIAEMRRLYTYNESVIAPLLEENEKIKAQAQSVGNKFCEREAQLIQKTYEGRSIDSFYRVNEFQTVFSYRLSALFLLLLGVYSASFLFAGEKENGMYALIKCSPNAKSLFFAKILAFFTFLCLLGLLYFGTDLIMFYLCLHPGGFFMPFYAIESYAYSSLNLSIISAYLLMSFLRVLGAFFVGCVVMLFSSLLKKAWHAFVLGVLSVAALMGLSLFTDGVFGVIRYFDPVTLMISVRLFETFRTVNVFGFPVFMSAVSVLSSALFGGGVLCGTYAVYKRRSGYA